MRVPTTTPYNWSTVETRGAPEAEAAAKHSRPDVRSSAVDPAQVAPAPASAEGGLPAPFTAPAKPHTRTPACDALYLKSTRFLLPLPPDQTVDKTGSHRITCRVSPLAYLQRHGRTAGCRSSEQIPPGAGYSSPIDRSEPGRAVAVLFPEQVPPAVIATSTTSSFTRNQTCQNCMPRIVVDDRPWFIATCICLAIGLCVLSCPLDRFRAPLL